MSHALLAPLFAAWAADAERARTTKLLPAGAGTPNPVTPDGVGFPLTSTPRPRGESAAEVSDALRRRLEFSDATDRIWLIGQGDTVEIVPNTVLCTNDVDGGRRVIREATGHEYAESEPTDGYRSTGGVGHEIRVCGLTCWVELEGELDP